MNTESSPPAADSPTPPDTTTTVWARMFNVLAAPGEVFTELRTSPTRSANWLLPALLLLLTGWFGGWLVARDPILQQQQSDLQDQALVKMGEKLKWSEQELDQQRRNAEERKGLGQGIGIAAVPVASVVVATFWWALMLWLIGAKLLRGDFAYGKALEAAGLIAVIEVLNKVLTPLLQLVMGTSFAAPTLLLPMVKGFQATNALHLTLASVNVLDVWGVAVSAVAVARLSGASFVKSAAWVFGLWLGWKIALIGVSLVWLRFLGL